METDGGLLLFTLGTAALATALLWPVGVLLAWWLARGRGFFRVVVETVASLPLVLPPTAVGLLLLMTFARQSPLGRLLESSGIELLFTWKAVVLASSVMAFPLFLRSARSAFEEVDPRLLAIARSLGSSASGAFFRVALPLSFRGLLAGTLLAFARALGEFGATMLVAGNIPGRTQTLALGIFERVELGHDSEAMGLLGLTVGLAFLAVLATELIGRRRAQRLSR